MQLESIHASSLSRVHLVDNPTTTEQMVRAPTPNTVLLTANAILVKGTNDDCSWELNLAALHGGLLYEL